MRVIGTAGHVDHGKSTLVEALTGIHPDRLKEEREREMTIDLGFAWMVLPGGEQVGIVDVPGHRDFIENMLAGVGGIDAVLLVVAADEGVMPQTREHLAILDLLQVDAGVIALTKADLILDPGWFELVEGDIRQAVQGTALANAPILRVSAKTGVGIDQLKAALVTCLAGRPARADLGRPRLPIDRVFTIAGFGTVVTGTLIDGWLKPGEEVEILPAGRRGRVRGLQSHKHKMQAAGPGSRTAVNVTGLEVEQIRRGDILAHPGNYRPTWLMDVSFRLLPGAAAPLRHSSEVKFFLGTAEILTRVRVLGAEELNPGEEGWLPLELRQPPVSVRGDRFILRRPSPGETLGGGVVVDPHPKSRHRRFAMEVLEQLEALRGGSPADILLQVFQASGAMPLREAMMRSRLAEEQALAGLQELLESKRLFLLEGGALSPESDLLAMGETQWEEKTSQAKREVENYHRSFPLRRGMPREELKSRLKIVLPRAFNAMVKRWVEEGVLEESGSLVKSPGFIIQFNPQQQRQVERLMARFAQAPYAPPPVKEIEVEIGEDGYNALLDMGLLISVSADVAFRKQDFGEMISLVHKHFEGEETLTAAQFRDQLNTSRRYVLAFLEHLDTLGVTMRDGDVRRLNKK
jgi:selenocysteine-specific elongation factor